MLLRAALLFAVANGIPTAYKHDTAIAHEADMDLESMTPEDIQALVPHDAMLEREKYGGGSCVEATLGGQANGCPIALAAGETPALGYCKKYFYVDGDVAKKCRHTDSPACQARGDKATQSASKKCPSGKALAQWYNGAEAGKAAMQADRARALITLDQLRLAQVRLAQVDPGSRLYPGMSSNAFMRWASALGRNPEGDIGDIKRDVCRITDVLDIVSHDFSPEEKNQLTRNCRNGDHSSGDQRLRSRSQVVEKWRSFVLELVFVLQGIRPAVPYYQGFIHMAATLVVGMCGDCLAGHPANLGTRGLARDAGGGHVLAPARARRRARPLDPSRRLVERAVRADGRRDRAVAGATPPPRTRHTRVQRLLVVRGCSRRKIVAHCNSALGPSDTPRLACPACPLSPQVRDCVWVCQKE